MNSKCYKVGGTQENGTLNVVFFLCYSSLFYQWPLPIFVLDDFHQHTTILWPESSNKKQATKHTCSLISSLPSMTVPPSVPHHRHISFAVHLGCLYCLIHFSLLNCDLASNTNYHTTETGFQVYVAKSNSYHTWFTKQQ